MSSARLPVADRARDRVSTAKAKRAAPEKRTQWAIIRDLTRMGFDVSSTSQPFRARTTVGIPDLYARHPRYGVRVWIEVKAGKNRPTPEQLAWHRAERAAGGVVIVAYSVADVLDGIVEAWPEMRNVWRR